jgi:hypothetical protein
VRPPHRPALLVAIGALSVGLACSQLPLAPGDQPVRLGYDALVGVLLGARDLILGALISAAISWAFARDSSKQLDRVAEALKVETVRVQAQLAELQDVTERMRTTLRHVAEVSGTPGLRPRVNTQGDATGKTGTRAAR